MASEFKLGAVPIVLMTSMLTSTLQVELVSTLTDLLLGNI